MRASDPLSSLTKTLSEYLDVDAICCLLSTQIVADQKSCFASVRLALSD